MARKKRNTTLAEVERDIVDLHKELDKMVAASRAALNKTGTDKEIAVMLAVKHLSHLNRLAGYYQVLLHQSMAA